MDLSAPCGTVTSIQVTAPMYEAVTSHKKDSMELPISELSIPSWKDLMAEWYSGGERPPMSVIRQAEGQGVPRHVPPRAKDRVRILTVVGFDAEQVIQAVPDLSPIHVVEIMERIPNEVFLIFKYHLNGFTPLEIAGLIDGSRPKVYYWLNRLGLRPHKRNRGELTARQRAQIVTAWKRGEPMTAIASRFGVSYDQVRYSVKKAA